MIVQFEDRTVRDADLTPVDDVTADVTQADSIRDGKQGDHLNSSIIKQYRLWMSILDRLSIPT